jgi:hypothetical protein
MEELPTGTEVRKGMLSGELQERPEFSSEWKWVLQKLDFASLGLMASVLT